MKFKVLFFLILSLLFVLRCKRAAQPPTVVEQPLPGQAKTSATILHHLQNPSDSVVLVVAHRGHWRYAPENSLQAVQRCIDLGVDVVEIDVQLTKDGHMVLMHDKTVDRTTNGTGKVSDLTLEEIKKLSLRNGCGIPGSRLKVPTLEEVMLAAKDKIVINLDKTEGETVREAYEILKKTGTVRQAIFKANDSYEAMRAKYGSLMDSIIFMPKLWYGNEHAAEHMADYERSLNPMMYEVLFDSEQSPTFSMIPQLKKQGDTFLAVALRDNLCAGHTDEQAITAGAKAAYGWLIAQGADAIMTDRSELLLDYLRKRGLRNFKQNTEASEAATKR